MHSEMIRNENEVAKNRVLKKIGTFIITFIISMIILCSGLVALIRFGVFPELRQFIVETAMTTMNHQYIAKIFADDDMIQEIMNNNRLVSGNSDKNAIHPSKNHDSGIEIIDIKGASFKGKLLVVKDPSRLDMGLSSGLGKTGEQVLNIVKDYKAVAGINGGGFLDVDGKGNGGIPLGILIKDYKILYADKLSSYSLVGIDKNNVLVLGNYTLSQIKRMNIRCAVSFQPFLIINGKSTIKSGNGGWGIAPRTVIGQKKDGTILFLVIDGRQVGSIGATLKDAQDIMLRYGAYNAANLDGGASTTLVYDNKIQNKPCSVYGPRYVPSAFIIK
jgi:exopolysaccharide biosynthesis protein